MCRPGKVVWTSVRGGETKERCVRIFASQNSSKQRKMGGVVHKSIGSSSYCCQLSRSKSSNKTKDEIESVNVSKEIFMTKNSRILSSNSEKKTHPELRLLRTLLRCDFGRPKLIQYLTRQTSIEKYHMVEQYGNGSFLSSTFYQQFLCSQSLSCVPPSPSHSSYSSAEERSIVMKTDYNEPEIPQITLLAAISSYQKFSGSEEYLEWIRYQYMLNENHSSHQSESLRSVSRFSSSPLAEEILYSNYEIILSKPHWIVALADVLQDLPFPATIFKTDNSMIHYANSAFVNMVGDSREDIAQHSHDIYHYSSFDSSSPPMCDPAIAYAIKNGSSIRIGTMYHPQSPLAPFLNLQSYLPIYDPEGHCNYFLVLHCDIWKHHQNPEYLQRLDILTDLLSKTVIPNRARGDIFLKAYFYDKTLSDKTSSL
jgi:hypothetical protein